MNYREFYKDATFTLLREGDSNWDYYLMKHGDSNAVVCLAKPGSGAHDCTWGGIEKFKQKFLSDVGKLNQTIRPFVFDYLRIEEDAEVLKKYLISQLYHFKDADDMWSYIRGEYPYFISDGKSFWSEVWQLAAKQFGKEYISQVENAKWYVDYFDSIAGKTFAAVCNSGLNTRKRTYMDYNAFYEKYKAE